MYLTDKAQLNMRYYDFDEKDFFIENVGYNDLHFIEPLRTVHIQKNYTIHFVLSGSGVLNIYGKQFNVNKNDVFFIPPDTNMSYYPTKEDPWCYIWFGFSGTNALIYEKKLGFSEKHPVIHCDGHLSASKAIFEGFKILDEGKNLSYYSALSMFYAVIDSIIPKEKNETTISDNVIAYLEYHYYDPDLKIEDICREMSISHSNLCKLFKTDKGISVKKALTDIRIEAAKKLLFESALSVEEVGYSVGFKDKFHFMKTFKEYTGITAGSYKKADLTAKL